jgi:tetratricopeptide (TPR) repeat protein
VEFLQDLSKEVEGFIAASETGDTQETTEPVQPEELPQLEGQIADIEFLLKEVEAPAMPSFEVEKEFEDFRNAIIWQTEDTTKKLTLAETAYNAELYETALSYIDHIKDDKTYWPLSIEIIGGALIKLGNYSEAIKVIGQVLLSEVIPEDQKIELRYLFVSAYEGIGDFENALREIEHIMTINPHYRDVKEIYTLLGGKKIFEEPAPAVHAKPEEERPLEPGEEEIPEEPQEIEKQPVAVEPEIEKEPEEITEEPTRAAEIPVQEQLEAEAEEPQPIETEVEKEPEETKKEPLPAEAEIEKEPEVVTEKPTATMEAPVQEQLEAEKEEPQPVETEVEKEPEETKKEPLPAEAEIEKISGLSEEGYPTIVEETTPAEHIPEREPKHPDVIEEQSENIAFL